MGFQISWIAVKGVDKTDVLLRAGLRDTGIVDEANESPFSGAEIPLGWFVLFSNDFDYAVPEKISALSAGGVAISCQVHEGIMYCAATYFRDGAEIWSVRHDAQEDIYDLHAAGSLPSEFDGIRDQCTRAQDTNGGKNSDIDFMFDVPVGVAAEICGYQHDRWKFEWGEPVFTTLDQI